MAPAPPPGSAAGASRWAPQPRALPGRGAWLCGISLSDGLRGFRARDPAGCEWAPVEREGGRSGVSGAAPEMIHELLLALSGYPGSIFTWNKRSGLQVCRGSETRRCSAAGAAEPPRRGGTRGTPTTGARECRETEDQPYVAPALGALRSRDSY